MSPLFVVEFLHRVVDTLVDYFNECSESTIKDNSVVVYELLDEMLDNGLVFYHLKKLDIEIIYSLYSLYSLKTYQQDLLYL